MSAPAIQTLVVCPGCRSALTWTPAEVRCAACARRYPIVEGVPVLLVEGGSADHDELDHMITDAQDHAGHEGHKRRQAAFFDRTEAAEFEVTRPRGTAPLHQWLLAEKFRRSVAGIEPLLAGATVVAVCAGSGMDAEFLARRGASVIAADISIGAARRAALRASRYGLAIAAIVADVERLPLGDQVVDIAYVHDGLHHLERPAAGLVEMARVARRAVSVTEPARAGVTAAAVRVGLAQEREEAGNRVARLLPREIAVELEVRGYRVVRSERYAMYYRHVPGRASAVLSVPGVLQATRGLWRAANAVAGRFGNKLTVQAVRA